MSPVEGEKYLGERLVGTLDSTEHGDTQQLNDFHPSSIQINCDPRDRFGALTVVDPDSVVRVSRLGRKGIMPFMKTVKIVELNKDEPIVFSGGERIFVTGQNSVYPEQIVLRHQKGRPSWPPFRKERGLGIRILQ